MNKKINFRKLAKRIAVLGDEKFAGSITVLDTRKSTSITDYQVIMSVYSHPQLNAVMEHISDELKHKKIVPLRKEGRKNAFWCVIDYGGVMAHIMFDEYRGFYRLERLWPDAKNVLWSGDLNVKRKTKKKSALGN